MSIRENLSKNKWTRSFALYANQYRYRVKSIYKLISDQKLSPTDAIESLPCSIFSHKNVKSSDGKCFEVRTRTNVKNCHRCLALFNNKFRFVIKVNRDFDWVFYLITITEFAQGNQRAIPSRLLTKRSAYASENLFQDEKTSSHWIRGKKRGRWRR